MRDAERRFETLRMRIEERTYGARGEQLVAMDVALRHPGDARVMTTEPAEAAAGNYELWISDGEIVRTYSAATSSAPAGPSGTARPRPRPEGPTPAAPRVYDPITRAARRRRCRSSFVHPAGYCQNVLATGRCWISGTDRGRRPRGDRRRVRPPARRRALRRPARLPRPGRRRSARRRDHSASSRSVGGEVTRARRGRPLRARRARCRRRPSTSSSPRDTTILY